MYSSYENSTTSLDFGGGYAQRIDLADFCIDIEIHSVHRSDSSRSSRLFFESRYEFLYERVSFLSKLSPGVSVHPIREVEDFLVKVIELRRSSG